jgi:hypothetical protein
LVTPLTYLNVDAEIEMGLLNSTVIGNENNETIKPLSDSTRPISPQLLLIISNLDPKLLSAETPGKSHAQKAQQQQIGNGYHYRRRTLPLLALWTIALDDLRSVSVSPRNPILQQLENQIINIIRISNGRPFPLPLWIFDILERSGSEEVKKIKECDIKFRTALAFYCCEWYEPNFRRIGLALFRYTCPLFPEGPILAYQRRRRLPEGSLIALIIFDEYGKYGRDIWNSNWKDGSILPQRAIFIDHRSGETHVIGILHQQLHHAATSQFRPEQHLQLASALIPHSRCYLNTPMHFEKRDALKLTPMEIVTFQGRQQLMEQLLSAGAEPLSMHPNEVKLRQLIRIFLIDRLPYKRLNDFEIDWKSDDVIRQGQHSKVYKASPKWRDEETMESCAVKIIPLTSTTTIEKIAHEITVIDRWIGVNELIGLEATAGHVAIITPFANGGTLEDYLPTLLIMKHDIMDNNNENDTMHQRHIKYLHHICPIVCGLFNRLIHQHKEHILHRDLRLSNIVFNDVSEIDEYVHIIDYGHATHTDSSRLDEDKQRSEDPYFYCVNAPEVVDGEPYTFASEMWSFGMILLSLWTCEKPFNDELLTNPLVSTLLLWSPFPLPFQKIIGLLSFE